MKKGLVGLRYQRAGVDIPSVQRRDPDAQRNRSFVPRGQLLHLTASLCQHTGTVPRGLGQYDHKLLAADASDEIGRAHAPLEISGNGFERIVTGRMAEFIVISLEVIGIQKQQRQR